MFSKIKNALSKTSKKIGGCLSNVFSKENNIDKIREMIEETLLEADFGVKLTSALISKIKIFNTREEILSMIHSEILLHLKSSLNVTDNFDEIAKNAPFVILMMGVNGTGKTTTSAKLANYYKEKGFKVRLVAADTFRAAAVEQLEAWARKIGVSITKGEYQSDSASVAYRGVLEARDNAEDVVIIDTAGRIHVRDDLMMELEKISRVIKKVDPHAPHDVLLVMDGTVGQSSINQVKKFFEKLRPTGLVVTKLDGTARGGGIVSVSDELSIPVRFLCVGEGVRDIELFSAESFAKSLLSFD